jgi:hypothetical protein
MTVSDQSRLAPVAVSVDNPEDWPDILNQMAAATGEPSTLTLDVLTATVGSAVPMLFAADSSGNMDVLRGTFAPGVIAQCQRNAGSLNGDEPVAVVLHLVGTPMRDGDRTLRVHLLVDTRSPDGVQHGSSQFWDFAFNAQVTVGRSSCPNCGAPLEGGQLVCDHCHTDVRQTVEAPLVVNRLELY